VVLVAELDGAQLAYEQAGAGPAIVFSHAGIADRRMWDHQFRAMARGHRVVRYDWRGYGDSSAATGTFSHHLDLLGLMDALDIPTAVLVGCSMGGAYAVDAALNAPDRVTGLVLIGSGLSGHEWPESMQEQVRERVHSAVPSERLTAYRSGTADQVREDDVEAMAEAQARFMVAGPDRDPSQVDPMVWQQSLDMLRKVFRRMWSEHPAPEHPPQPPATDRLRELDVPVLVVNGLADVAGIQQVAEILTDGIPGARRFDLPATGHLAPMERPEQVTTALQDFCRDLHRC
jgi:pimeloyl-ACP methyl ester carboxylesterase